MAVKPNFVSYVVKLLQESKGFDKVLNKVKIISAGDGNCIAEYKVAEENTNPMGTLHGGYSATLVDVISSYALFTKENCNIMSVSVDLNLSYLKSAKIGEDIIIDAKTLRAGNTLAYLDVEIKNKASGDLLVRGSHTKFFLRPKE